MTARWDDCLVVLELARQDAKVDYPARLLVDDVDDFGDSWRILVTGHDDGTGRMSAGSRASRRKAPT